MDVCTELDAPRDVDFSLVVVSQVHDYFVQCAFDEPLDLSLQLFLRSGGVKVMLLPLNNGSADILLRLTSSDRGLIKEMTAWLEFNEALLHSPCKTRGERDAAVAAVCQLLLVLNPFRRMNCVRFYFLFFFRLVTLCSNHFVVTIASAQLPTLKSTACCQTDLKYAGRAAVTA